MHNREMIWTTKDNRKVKLIDMSSNHLTNLYNFINSHIYNYEMKFGKSKTKKILHNIKQEIRFRKLNRLELSKDEDKLF